MKISGSALKNIAFTASAKTLTPDAQGELRLRAEDAELHGDQIGTEIRGDHLNIAFWDKSAEWVSWPVRLPQPGTYKLSASIASLPGGSEFVIDIGGQQLHGKAEKTADWDQFHELNLGQIEVKTPGEHVVMMRPNDPEHWHPMNLRFLKLVKAD